MESGLTQEVAALLEPASRLLRVDGQDMPELVEIRAQAMALMNAAEQYPVDPDTADMLQRVCDGTHPLTVLVRVAGAQVTHVGDAELEAAFDTIQNAFGTRIGILAMSGRLVIAPSSRLAGAPARSSQVPLKEELQAEPSAPEAPRPIEPVPAAEESPVTKVAVAEPQALAAGGFVSGSGAVLAAEDIVVPAVPIGEEAVNMFVNRKVTHLITEKCTT